MAAVPGNLARSIGLRFPCWGPCGDVMGTFAPNVPMTYLRCFVSVTDAMGTLGKLGTFSGPPLRVRRSRTYLCTSVRENSSRVKRLEKGPQRPQRPHFAFK